MAFLLDEPAAVQVESELRDASQPAHISALNLAEVVDVMARIYKRPSSSTMDALILLEAGGLEVVPVDADLGVEAGQLHARLYDRQTSPLSMADCVALATAATLGERLATSDPPLAAAAASEGVGLIPLLDSRGGTPGP